MLGLAAGKLAQIFLVQVYPQIPFTAPWWAALAAPLTAIATAALFTVVPAARAAKLDPVTALSRR
jgi:putative ABC transport system permease protein